MPRPIGHPRLMEAVGASLSPRHQFAPEVEAVPQRGPRSDEPRWNRSRDSYELTGMTTRARTQVVLAALAALVTALTLALAGCGSSGKPGAKTSAPAGPVVSVKLLMFMPDPLTIKAGQSVTWRNDEPITHTVTSGTVTGIDPKTSLRAGQQPDGLFNAKLPTKGSTFTFTFTKPGTYSYYCDIHEGMNASVLVTP
jgi:plastocyanin